MVWCQTGMLASPEGLSLDSGVASALSVNGLIWARLRAHRVRQVGAAFCGVGRVMAERRVGRRYSGAIM